MIGHDEVLRPADHAEPLVSRAALDRVGIERAAGRIEHERVHRLTQKITLPFRAPDAYTTRGNLGALGGARLDSEHARAVATERVENPLTDVANADETDGRTGDIDVERAKHSVQHLVIAFGRRHRGVGDDAAGESCVEILQ